MMNANNLKKNDRVWCWWLSRYLWFKGQNARGEFIFEDICDEGFEFTAADVAKLVIK